jgi:DNA-binding transcriptional LysR family regulator
VDWSNRIGRRIKLRDLHILQAVVDQGSISKAARRLAVSQPVISKVVADLERELGRPLLDRDRHGAEPTIYGAALLKHSLAVFDELKQGVEEIEYLADPTKGELRVGAHAVIAAGFLSAVVKSLHRRHPNLVINIKLSMAADTLFRELRERSVDLVVGRNLTQDAADDLKAERLFNETNVIVVGRHNPLARRRKIELADLVDKPWLFPAADSVVKHIAAEMFRLAGLEMPRRGIVYASSPVYGALVADGPYLTIPPVSFVRFGGSALQLKILPIKFPVPPSPVGIITLKRRTVSPVAQLFIEHAREVAKLLANKET